MSEKARREFDFSKHPSKHIVIRIAYQGQHHDGLARQLDTTNTIEHYLLTALAKVRLVPEVRNPETENPAALLSPAKFSRCGRTDKGVSALGNAISLVVRASADDAKPLQYCRMLNKTLPPTIRATAWAFVPDDFDARFSCLHRTYRYFFNAAPTARRPNALNIEKMKQAASLLLGSHDFRNFCKMDVVNVNNFVREIKSVEIVACEEQNAACCSANADSTRATHYLQIQGNAFLYHQIRCTMAVLFLVGEEKEEPDVIPALLDVDKHSRKPCYQMAADAPLVLWDCAFDPKLVQWRCEADAVGDIEHEWNEVIDEAALRLATLSQMKQSVVQLAAKAEVTPLHPKVTTKYVPLLKRPTEHTLTERIESLSGSKKRRRDENMSHDNASSVATRARKLNETQAAASTEKKSEAE